MKPLGFHEDRSFLDPGCSPGSVSAVVESEDKCPVFRLPRTKRSAMTSGMPLTMGAHHAERFVAPLFDILLK